MILMVDGSGDRQCLLLLSEVMSQWEARHRQGKARSPVLSLAVCGGRVHYWYTSATCPIPIPPNYWIGLLVTIIVEVICYVWLVGAKPKESQWIHLGRNRNGTEPNLFLHIWSVVRGNLFAFDEAYHKRVLVNTLFWYSRRQGRKSILFQIPYIYSLPNNLTLTKGPKQEREAEARHRSKEEWNGANHQPFILDPLGRQNRTVCRGRWN